MFVFNNFGNHEHEEYKKVVTWLGRSLMLLHMLFTTYGSPIV